MAKVWAFRMVSIERGLALEHTEIEKLATKIGLNREHPSPQAIQKLRTLFDDDPSWYPCKGFEMGRRPGPKPRFTPQKKSCVAECIMAMALRQEDVTVEAVLADAIRACTNRAKHTQRLRSQLCLRDDPTTVQLDASQCRREAIPLPHA